MKKIFFLSIFLVLFSVMSIAQTKKQICEGMTANMRETYPTIIVDYYNDIIIFIVGLSDINKDQSDSDFRILISDQRTFDLLAEIMGKQLGQKNFNNLGFYYFKLIIVDELDYDYKLYKSKVLFIP